LDAEAPLPSQPGDAGFNAIFARGAVYVPLFSTPSCVVVPPYGDSYVVNALSAFNGAGVAIGAMNTTEGIVPLQVKRCP